MWAISTNNCLETLDGSCGVSILSCLLLDCFYVGSLYIWRGNLPRDHTSTIKRRFISVSVVSALSVVTVWKWAESMELHPSPYVPVLLDLLGVRLEGLLAAAVLPLVLTMLLFLGPLAQCALASGRDCPPEARLVLDPRSLAACVSDARWLRNQVMAPLTEELVFRACMLPMLVPCTGSIGAILISPLFFSLAHFHHVIERLHAGQDTVSEILLCAVIQFCYTYVFGVYSSFLFIRTGHLLGAVLCHSLCNAIGFPDVGGVMEHPQHLVILFCYLLGVLLFVLLLFPLTDPILYGGAPPLCGPPLHPQAACLA